MSTENTEWISTHDRRPPDDLAGRVADVSERIVNAVLETRNLALCAADFDVAELRVAEIIQPELARLRAERAELVEGLRQKEVEWTSAWKEVAASGYGAGYAGACQDHVHELSQILAKFDAKEKP